MYSFLQIPVLVDTEEVDHLEVEDHAHLAVEGIDPDPLEDHLEDIDRHLEGILFS